MPVILIFQYKIVQSLEFKDNCYKIATSTKLESVAHVVTYNYIIIFENFNTQKFKSKFYENYWFNFIIY